MQNSKHESGGSVLPDMRTKMRNGYANRAAAEAGGERLTLQNIETATAGWLDQMAAMRRVEEEFAMRLIGARTASDAVSVCSEWLAKRVDSLVAVQHHLLDLWLQGEAGRLERGSAGAPIEQAPPLDGKDRTSA